MKKILITGYNGFVGQHCAEIFKSKGFEVVGISNHEGTEKQREFVDEALVCDLANPEDTDRLVLDGLDVVLNLAGFATNTGGDEDLINRVNIGAHVNLYRRIHKLGLSPRIIAVSSGAVYDPNQPMPETEDSRLKDPSEARAYEASKIHMEQALKEFEGSLDIVIARPFNHIGPGQGMGFIVPEFSAQIDEAIKSGSDIKVGNLRSRRDYTSVRDVARAYLALATAEHLGHSVYNVCSGKSYSGEEILTILLKAFEAPDGLEVVVDQSKLRGKSDDTEIIGSYERIHTDTGWEPTESVEKTLQDFVEWYRPR